MPSNLIDKYYNFWHNPNERTRKINRNVIYSFFLKGMSILVSLLLVPLTLGYLDAYEYGVWITLNSVLTWINVLDVGLGNGLRNKLTECIAVGDLHKGKIYVSTTFALLSLISIMLCVVAIVANVYVDWNAILNISCPISNLNRIVNIVLVCLSFNFTLRTVGLIYLSYQETFANGMLGFLGSVLSLVWIWCLTKLTSPSLMNVAIAFSASPLIVYILAFPYTFIHQYKELCPSIKFIQKRYVRTLGGLGIQFFLLQIACLVLFFTSNLLISNIFSPEEVTPYSIAFKYFNVVTSVFMIILTPMWSAITDAYVKKDLLWLKTNMRKSRFIFYLCTLVMLIMVLCSKIAYRVWVGDNVEITYTLSLSLAIFNTIYIWSLLYSTWCNGVGHLKLALYSMCAAALLFIPLCLIITKFVGLPGVAFALSLVLAIPSVALYMQYIKDIRKLEEYNA